MRRALPLPLLAILLLTACPSTLARRNALFPIVASEWPAVKDDVDRGLGGGTPPPDVKAAIAQIEAAIAANDPTVLRGVTWPPVQALAVQGVARRVASGTSHGVAESLLKRIEQFSKSIEVLAR